MKLKQHIIAATLLIVTANAVTAQNGTKLSGYDAKTIGRGGIVTGFFDNTTLLQTNPAGISFLKSSQVDFSFSGMVPHTHFTNDLNDTKGKNNFFPLGSVAYVHRPYKKFTYGVGIFTEGGLGADYNLKHKLFTDPSDQPRYHSKFAVLQAGGTLAYKITDKFSVGVTAQLVYSQLEFGAPLSMPPAMMQGAAGSGTFGAVFAGDPLNYTEVTGGAYMDKLTALGFSGKVGLAYKPNDKVSFGLNYTLPTALSFSNGNANMNFKPQFDDAYAKMVKAGMSSDAVANKFAGLGIDVSPTGAGFVGNYAAKAKFKTPQSLAGGVSFSAVKTVRVGVDVEWINWKNAFKSMDVTLTDGTNPNINKLLGANSIAFPFPMNWKNTVVIRTGGEVDITETVTARAGYIYGGNPVPASTLFPVLPAVVQHHVTLGASVKLSDSVGLNLAYEHAFKNEQTSSSASLVGAQYNNSKSSLAVDVYHVSVSWTIL